MDGSRDPPLPSTSARRASGASSDSEPQRQRVLRACSACHTRRTRCDGKQRCSSCRENGITCFYVPSTRKRGPPKGCPPRGGVRKKVRDDVDGASTNSGNKIPAQAQKQDEKPVRRRSSSSSPGARAHTSPRLDIGANTRNHEVAYANPNARPTQAHNLHSHHHAQPNADVQQGQPHTSSHDHPYNNVRRQRLRSNASTLPPISDLYSKWTADHAALSPFLSGSTPTPSTSDSTLQMPPSPSRRIFTSAADHSVSVAGLPAFPPIEQRSAPSPVVSALHSSPSFADRGPAFSRASVPSLPLTSSQIPPKWSRSFPIDDAVSLPPPITSIRRRTVSTANAMPSLPLSPPPLPPPLTTTSSFKDATMPSTTIPAGLRVMVSREMVDDWLSIYETIIHTQWPILYRSGPSWVRDLEVQRPLLYDAILAISSTCHRQEFEQSYSDQYPSPSSASSALQHKSNSRKMSEDMIESVRTRIVNAGIGNSKLEHVQALIIVALYDLGAGQASTAYQMGGIACRMACDLGLHMLRPTSRTEMPSESDRQTNEEEKRVLWACYVLDKILSALLQRPPGLRFCDLDTPKPSMEDYDENTPKFTGPASRKYVAPEAREKMSSAKSCVLSTFNSWCDVMKNLETILDELYRPAAYSHRLTAAKEAFQCTSDTSAFSASTTFALQEQNHFVEQIDRSLTVWRQLLPQHLYWNGDDSVDEHLNTSPNILNLRGWYYICKLLLHRTFIPSWMKTRLPLVDNRDRFRHSFDSEEDRYRRAPVDSLEGEFMMEPKQKEKRRKCREMAGSPSMASSLPRDLSATRQAAECICQVIEGYLTTFREKSVSAAWIYFVFHAGVIHAALSSPSSHSMISSVVERERRSPDIADWDGRSPVDAVQAIVNSSQRSLNRCIAWLDQMSVQWKNADHHVRVLRDLSSVGCPLAASRQNNVRVHHLPFTAAAAFYPSSSSLMSTAKKADYTSDLSDPSRNSHQSETESIRSPHVSVVPTDDLLMIKNQLLFWGSMPTSSEELSLWCKFRSRFDPVR